MNKQTKENARKLLSASFNSMFKFSEVCSIASHPNNNNNCLFSFHRDRSHWPSTKLRMKAGEERISREQRIIVG